MKDRRSPPALSVEAPLCEKGRRRFHGKAEVLRRLNAIAPLAAASGHAWGPFVSTELARLADKIKRDGRTPEHLAMLRALAIPAVGIERDTGAPVAKHLTAVIRVFTKPPKPQPYVSPAQWARRSLWKRRHLAPYASMRREKRPPE